ncbi:hypothetical protein G3I44_14455 [Halogeometricum borinquense]|uniref:Uncharacterized protein n=1 Tax=Halogeometricum borinquense TaxID=60847 RepID=A0A6C0UR20_9EURY|nr:hypothetical protein [Halogeometricum borinquense]QIB75388.1 hypothetical protein G3I44_14455 [Halogeometricum borinquense]
MVSLRELATFYACYAATIIVALPVPETDETGWLTKLFFLTFFAPIAFVGYYAITHQVFSYRPDPLAPIRGPDTSYEDDRMTDNTDRNVELDLDMSWADEHGSDPDPEDDTRHTCGTVNKTPDSDRLGNDTFQKWLRAAINNRDMTPAQFQDDVLDRPAAYPEGIVEQLEDIGPAGIELDRDGNIKFPFFHQKCMERALYEHQQ